MKTNITAEQYRTLIALGPEPQTLAVIAILEGVEQNGLKVSSIDKWRDFPFETLIPSEEANWALLFRHEGVLYGMRKMEDLTLGELIDIMEWGKDIHTNLISLMTLLWRPVSYIPLKSRLKARWAEQLIKIGKPWSLKMGIEIMNDLYYEIEDYIPSVADGRYKTYKGFPGHVAHYCTTFMYTFSRIYATDLLLSTTKMMMESLKKVNTNK